MSEHVEMDDATPPPYILKAIRGRGITHAEAFAELIDNALDAGATRIAIEMWRDRITATDNGRGVTRDNVRAMIKPGAHTRGNDAGLGLYGIGFNLAALSFADEVEIAGVNRGTLVRGSVDWAAMFRKGSWAYPSPRESAATDDDRAALGVLTSGTRITFTKLLHKQTLSGQNFDTMCDRVRFMFTPALRNGMQIAIKAIRGQERPLGACEMPPFDVSVDAVVSVAGLSVRVRCGVVKEGARNDYRGFAVAFRHRYIQRSAVFCGDAPAARIAGEIMLLDDEWRHSLNDTKTALCKHESEIADAVRETCADVFRAAAGQARVLRISGLSSRAEAIVRGADEQARAREADSKAKRAPRKNASGPVAPTGTGPKHTRAARTQAGRTFAGRVARGLRIEFAPLGPSTIGETDIAAGRVTLNDEHPHVRRIVAADDAHAVAAAAVFLLAHEQSSDATGKQRVFSFADSAFGELVGRVLAACEAPEALTVAKAV